MRPPASGWQGSVAANGQMQIDAHHSALLSAAKKACTVSRSAEMGDVCCASSTGIANDEDKVKSYLVLYNSKQPFVPDAPESSFLLVVALSQELPCVQFPGFVRRLVVSSSQFICFRFVSFSVPEDLRLSSMRITIAWILCRRRASWVNIL